MFEFPNFILLWGKVHRLTQQYGFTPQEQYAILKQVLAPPALTFVKDLPPESPDSYAASIKCLYEMFYDRKTNLTNVITSLVHAQSSDGSYESRQRTLGLIHSYTNSVASLGADDKAVRTAWELHFTTRLLDQGWAKDWAKFYHKRRNLSNPLGADVTLVNLTTCLRDQIMQMMLNTQFLQESNRRGGGGGGGMKPPIVPDNRFRGNKGHAAPAAATQKPHIPPPPPPPPTSAPAPTGAAAAAAKGAAAAANKKPQFQKRRQKKEQNTDAVIVPCIYCNGATTHAYPLQCHKIRDRLLTYEEIRQICIRAKACRMCMDRTHHQRNCTTNMRCGYLDNGIRCQEKHFRAFHKCSSTGNFLATPIPAAAARSN